VNLSVAQVLSQRSLIRPYSRVLASFMASPSIFLEFRVTLSLFSKAYIMRGQTGRGESEGARRRGSELEEEAIVESSKLLGVLRCERKMVA
jgi:hypothetical protein